MNAAVLVYGYGNPGRLDDGLGPALVHELRARGLGTLATLEMGYQLQVEHAELVARYSVVVFADAHTACAAPFELRPLAARRAAAFTTHALAPETVLGLAREHFVARTAGFALGIRGYEFDGFGEGLSDGARRNLAAAADFLCQAVRDGSLAQQAAADGPERGEPCPSPSR